ncbi:endonuclease [Vibrio phage phiVC8]|uniref:Uncharacterized protein n=1 Tax=Vibrio phage phiVC8 TaxID=1076759 RepID=G3FFN9_BPVC8|nr:endonuclease [Vibrio phage phiVC8]AEM62927.1 hypothetical protein phiVC8_p30 [Vibrio phage phiVC8]
MMCKVCEQSGVEFYPYNKSTCKKCIAARARKSGKRSPEAIERRKKRQSERRKANAKKYQARNAVNNAIRDGRLVKADQCNRCLETEGLHGHHHDYDKPLDVEWLCVNCHLQEHGQR